jgi:hypothetical protein
MCLIRNLVSRFTPRAASASYLVCLLGDRTIDTSESDRMALFCTKTLFAVGSCIAAAMQLASLLDTG